MTVQITANDRGNPAGKLADAELHFTNGPLAGLRLIGFAIWEQYSVNGERRSFALLRPISDTVAQDHVRQLILEALVDYEEQAAVAREAGA